MSEVTGPQYNAPPGCWSIAPGLVRPKSRGRVYLASSDPKALILVNAGFLRDPADLKACKVGIELCREVGNSAPMSEFVKREVAPAKKLDDAALADIANNANTSCFHQSCTCKMGTDDMSVVDSHLSVHGVEGLTIADASIMRRIVTSNTMAATCVIGERAVDILTG